MNLVIWILPDVIAVLCVLIAAVLTRWLHRLTRQTPAAETPDRSPIEDSITWKRRRRLADARQWQEQWDRILPVTPTPTNIPARQTSELRALSGAYITADQARAFYRGYWGGWDGRDADRRDLDAIEDQRRAAQARNGA